MNADTTRIVRTLWVRRVMDQVSEHEDQTNGCLRRLSILTDEQLLQFREECETLAALASDVYTERGEADRMATPDEIAAWRAIRGF